MVVRTSHKLLRKIQNDLSILPTNASVPLNFGVLIQLSSPCVHLNTTASFNVHSAASVLVIRAKNNANNYGSKDSALTLFNS